MQDRLERFAPDVFALTKGLLRDIEARNSALQLRDAASAAHSNYGSVCVARSHADFASKIGIALEEADESRRWLRLLKAAGLLRAESVDALLDEAGELRAILSSAHLTAKRNRNRYKRERGR